MCESVAAGLDARAAAIVMKAVKNTVRTGRTVVCTIHQPSLEIFQVLYCTDTLVHRQTCANSMCMHTCAADAVVTLSGLF